MSGTFEGRKGVKEEKVSGTFEEEKVSGTFEGRKGVKEEKVAQLFSGTRCDWKSGTKPQGSYPPRNGKVSGTFARPAARSPTGGEKGAQLFSGTCCDWKRDQVTRIIPAGTAGARMTLPAAEFLERLALHIVPRGFVRVRAFGFVSNRHRADKLALIRGLLQVPPPAELAGLLSDEAADQSSVAQAAISWAARMTSRNQHQLELQVQRRM